MSPTRNKAHFGAIAFLIFMISQFLPSQSRGDEHAQETSAQAPHSGASNAGATEEWNRLNETEKEKIRENFREWKRLSPEERSELKERYRKFRDLPPERQAELRRRFERYQTLSPAQKQVLRDRVKRFQELPKEDRIRRIERIRERRNRRTR